MSQSKSRSWKEAWVNIFIGYSINFCANLIVFPMFGYNISIHDNLMIGVVFTFISLARQYIIRRWFNKNDDEQSKQVSISAAPNVAPCITSV